MSKKLSLMFAAAVLSVAAVWSANASVASDRFESASIVRVFGSDISPLARHVSVDESAVQDFVVRDAENNGSRIVEAGIWSSVKNAAKSVGGKVKSAAKTAVKLGKGMKDGVKSVGGKVMDAGKAAGWKLTGAVKKVVTTTGKVIAKVPGVGATKKLAQKIGTKIGKKIADRI